MLDRGISGLLERCQQPGYKPQLALGAKPLSKLVTAISELECIDNTVSVSHKKRC